MKAVARLIYLYFFGAAGLRWLSGAGLISIAACTFLWRWRPDWLPAIVFAWVGLAALFVGTALMPVMVARTAGGHWHLTVPHLRTKLLVSALLTVLLMALPVLVLTYAGVGQTGSLYVRHLTPKLLEAARAANFKLMWVAFLGAANLFTWLYVVAWLVTSRRNAWGLFRGLVVLSLVLYAPAKEVATLDASLWLNLSRLCATWVVFAVLFLTWPRWIGLRSRLLRHFVRKGAGVVHQSSQDLHAPGEYSPGGPLRASIPRHATDLVLGTAHPWLMAATLTLPTLLAARISTYFPGAWLYCLALFSTCSAALAGQASERSRALWLAGGWSRIDLFRQIERSYWKHNFIVLAVLLVVMVAVGTYVNLGPRLIALGVPLLGLGTALGTYLGLMVTRGMRWLETTLGIGVMLALMAGALMAVRADLTTISDVVRLTGLAVALVAAAIAFRSLSRRRWEHLDWAECRAERVIRTRAVLFG